MLRVLLGQLERLNERSVSQIHYVVAASIPLGYATLLKLTSSMRIELMYP